MRDAIRSIISKLTGAEKRKAQTAEGKLTAALEAASKQAASLQGKADGATMATTRNSLKEDLENGRAREETREAFLRRASGGGYAIFEGDTIAYGFQRVRHSSESGYRGETSPAVKTREELKSLGIDADVIHGPILWNLNGITGERTVSEAVTLEGKKILINDTVSVDARNAAGHEAFHLWKNGVGRDAYIETVEDNLIFTNPDFLQYQSTIAEAYLGGEVDLANERQVKKLREELFAYISGDIHEGTNDEFMRPMFRDFEAVKAAWSELVATNASATRFSMKDVTEDEAAALLQYKSSESYKINAKLRDGTALTPAEQKMVADLDAALEKLPVHEGTVYRRLSFDMEGQEALDAFLAEHTEGSLVPYKAYTSSSTAIDGYPVSGELTATLVIDSKTGRDMTGIGNNNESEILFARNTRFYVENVETDADGKTAIYMEEVAKHGAGQLHSEERLQKMQQLQASPGKDGKLQKVPGVDTRRGADGRGLPGVRGEGNEKVRFSLKEYTDEEKQQHIKDAADYFGRTYKWAETGYITTDGRRLDFSGRHEGGPGGYRTVDHRDIRDALGDDYGGDDYSGSMVQFMSEGNIRISPESGGIDLSVMPTKAQMQTLSDFISKQRGEVILDLDTPDGRTISSTEYPRGTHANKVLADIKGYFENGTTPRVSELAQFRYSLKTDSKGRELTEEQQEFFEESVVRDAEGLLLPVFHTTYDEFYTFDREKLGAWTDGNASDELMAATAHIGFWFNTQDLRRSYGNGSRAEEVYLNITNPLKLGSLEELSYYIALNGNGESAAELGESTADVLRGHDYDGIVLRDEEFGGTSYVVLDPEQIKRVDNKAPTSDPDIRYSLKKVGGKETVWIENSPLTNRELRDHRTVARYIAQHIGEVYTIIESGQKVFLGKELPSEYTQSKYTSYLRQRDSQGLKAKNKAVGSLGELIEIATNRRWENTVHPKTKDAKYGMYRYDSSFAFPLRDQSGNMVDIRSYDVELLIRNASDGKKYLYDIVGIKENTTNAIDLQKSEARKAAYQAASQGSASAVSISDDGEIVNGDFSLKGSETARETAKLREENDLLRERVDYWKGQTKRTTRVTTDKKAVAKAAGQLIENFGADMPPACPFPAAHPLRVRVSSPCRTKQPPPRRVTAALARPKGLEL